MSRGTISIRKLDVRVVDSQMIDPPTVLYIVELSTDTGVWPETIGSREALLWFLRGVQAGASMPELRDVTYEVPA